MEIKYVWSAILISCFVGLSGCSSDSSVENNGLEDLLPDRNAPVSPYSADSQNSPVVNDAFGGFAEEEEEDCSCAELECGINKCGESCGECMDGFSCEEGACVEEVEEEPQDETPCEPDCAEVECGPDGCGGTCGSCDAPTTCQDGFCLENCLPNCGGAVCGDDGCGGSCGTCSEGQNCVDGGCSDECVPDCTDKECGDDSCGGLCGACPEDSFCVEFLCASECEPDCTGLECGDDGCGGSCGTCTGTRSVSRVNALLVASPIVSAKSAETTVAGILRRLPERGKLRDGSVYPGLHTGLHRKELRQRWLRGNCGECPYLRSVSEGSCEAVCTPDCNGKECGTDGCGGVCGICLGATICTNGVCASPGCTPQCGGKMCGPDGCGGLCGSCEPGQICTISGTCMGGGCTPDCTGKQCGMTVAEDPVELAARV